MSRSSSVWLRPHSPGPVRPVWATFTGAGQHRGVADHREALVRVPIAVAAATGELATVE